MKISKLIKKITDAAEMNFGLSGHINDAYSVEIGKHEHSWSAVLVRPTARQLDSGEIENTLTVRQWESTTSFQTIGASLADVLKRLLFKVENASDWSDGWV